VESSRAAKRRRLRLAGGEMTSEVAARACVSELIRIPVLRIPPGRQQKLLADVDILVCHDVDELSAPDAVLLLDCLRRVRERECKQKRGQCGKLPQLICFGRRGAGAGAGRNPGADAATRVLRAFGGAPLRQSHLFQAARAVRVTATRRAGAGVGAGAGAGARAGASAELAPRSAPATCVVLTTQENESDIVLTLGAEMGLTSSIVCKEVAGGAAGGPGVVLQAGEVVRVESVVTSATGSLVTERAPLARVLVRVTASATGRQMLLAPVVERRATRVCPWDRGAPSENRAPVVRLPLAECTRAASRANWALLGP